MLTSLSTSTGPRALTQGGRRRRSRPSRHDRRRHRRPGRELDRPGHRPRYRARRAARASARPAGRRTSPRASSGPDRDRRRSGCRPVLDQYVAGEVGHRHPRVGGAEVGSENHARVAVEGERLRRPPAGRCARARRNHQSLGEQGIHPRATVERARPVSATSSCAGTPPPVADQAEHRAGHGPGRGPVATGRRAGADVVALDPVDPVAARRGQSSGSTRHRRWRVASCCSSIAAEFTSPHHGFA